MSNLAEDLIATPQREKAGRRSNNRNDFQTSWALCKLLELHQSGADYVVISEYHDDVLVIDSADEPTSAAFFQVKSRKGSTAWTRARLLGRKRGQERSILGAVYENYLRFPLYCDEATLVSNLPYKLKRTDGQSTLDQKRVCLDELSKSDSDYIQEKLAAEHNLQALAGGVNRTFLELTSLSVDDHDTNALGRLMIFVGSEHPTLRHQTQALEKTLRSELKRGSKGETDPADFRDLVTEQGISRSDFAQMLEDAAQAVEAPGTIRAVENRLNNEQVEFRRVATLVRSIKLFEVQRKDPTNTQLHDLNDRIADLAEGAAGPRLIDMVDQILQSDEAVIENVRAAFGDDLLQAAIVIGLYEQLQDTDQLSPASPTSADQEK